MRTIEINLYQYNELSEEAKEKAFNDFCSNDYYHWNGENNKVLEWFKNTFDVKIIDWEYGYQNYISWESEYTTDQDELTGKRLISFLWNNYKNDLFQGKYYSKTISTSPYRYKSRRSKILLEDGCPTGYYLGSLIIDPMLAVLRGEKIQNNYTLYDCLNDCLDAWIEGCRDDYEHYYSMENFKELSEANEWEYNENGELV